MKARWLVLGGSLAVLLQLVWPHSNPTWAVVPNFFLVTVVLFSPFVDARRLLWLAFGGGLALDLLSTQQFGFNMAFFVLLVLILKSALNFSDRTTHLTAVVLSAALATVAYEALLHLGLAQSVAINQWPALFSRTSVQVLYNVVLVTVVGSAIRLGRSGIIVTQ